MNEDKEIQLKEGFVRELRLTEYGIPAALRRNSLYKKKTTDSKRKEIRDYWRKQLIDLGEKYSNTTSIAQYMEDLIELKQRMNKKYQPYFLKDGFRISHSQKSLSVYLKFRWCNNEIPEPPFCPVDRLVLKSIRKKAAWTKMKDKEFLAVIKYIEDFVNNYSEPSIAKWELELFDHQMKYS